jgi:hypothetical protein
LAVVAGMLMLAGFGLRRFGQARVDHPSIG